MIRPMTTADVPAAAAIARESMPQPWSETAFLRELENPYAMLLAAEDDVTGQLQGYISLLLTDYAELAGIAVRPADRRQGIASALLLAAREKLRAREIYAIDLEVRQSNRPAIAFYEKHGFSTIGERPNFYENPREAALLMTDAVQ